MFQISQKLFDILLRKPSSVTFHLRGLMEYLSNNRGRNCLDKWSTHKSFSHMSRKWINVMILIIFF